MVLNTISVTSLLLSSSLITSLMLCTALNQTFDVCLKICHTKWSDDYISSLFWGDELWGLVNIISSAPRRCTILYRPSPALQTTCWSSQMTYKDPQKFKVISWNSFKDTSKVLTLVKLWFIVYSSEERSYANSYQILTSCISLWLYWRQWDCKRDEFDGLFSESLWVSCVKVKVCVWDVLELHANLPPGSNAGLGLPFQYLL